MEQWSVYAASCCPLIAEVPDYQEESRSSGAASVKAGASESREGSSGPGQEPTIARLCLRDVCVPDPGRRRGRRVYGSRQPHH